MLTKVIPLVLFNKNILIPVPDFFFTLTFIAHTLHHNTTLTHTHPWHLLLLIDTYHPAMWSAKVVEKIENGSHSRLYLHKAGYKCSKCKKSKQLKKHAYAHAHTHTLSFSLSLWFKYTVFTYPMSEDSSI